MRHITANEFMLPAVVSDSLPELNHLAGTSQLRTGRGGEREQKERGSVGGTLQFIKIASSAL